MAGKACHDPLKWLKIFTMRCNALQQNLLPFLLCSGQSDVKSHSLCISSYHVLSFQMLQLIMDFGHFLGAESWQCLPASVSLQLLRIV